MSSELRIIPGESTPSSQRHMEITFLLSRLAREGALLSQMVKTEKGYRRMYYATPKDDEKRRHELYHGENKVECCKYCEDEA